MAALEIFLFGKPEARFDNRTLVFPTRKTMALLAYLLVERGLHSREKLATLFWPESNSERSRGALRTTLAYLRNIFPTNNPKYLLVDNDTIGFNFDTDYWLDLQQVQVAYQQVLQPSEDFLSQLNIAVENYRADFLEDFSLNDSLEFDQWCSLQRETYHRQMNAIFEQLFDGQVVAGKAQLAINTANRWIHHDLLHESSYYKLIELYINDANRVSALRTYESYYKILENELGIPPSPQLEILMRRLDTLPVITKESSVIPDKKPLTGKQILVAEDDVDLRLVLTMQLKSVGYIVTGVENGQTAMQLLQQQSFDLIITDVMMPGMTGYELARAVRLTDKCVNLPILMLTSLSSPEDALLAFRDGVDAFVSKPCDYQKLKLKVATLLEGRPETPLDMKAIKSLTSSGIKALDEALGGSWPAGSNFLLVGDFGSGKSTFARHFLIEGLLRHEPGLLISLNDNITRVRHELNMLTGGLLAQYESQDDFRLIDASEWLYLIPDSLTALTKFTEVIMSAGDALGQNTLRHRGGRRVVDNISGLLIHYDLATVQRFLIQLARTAQTYGEVSSLFVLEKDSVNEHTLNNLKYFMDGVFEFRVEKVPEIRIADLKWQAHSKEWFPHNYY
jgi:DNA-binding SARP family transcriptional activator/KaiC/GvpD/RAD55 family RecA-like ATPase